MRVKGRPDDGPAARCSRRTAGRPGSAVQADRAGREGTGRGAGMTAAAARGTVTGERPQRSAADPERDTRRVSFQVEPGGYRHWRLTVEGPVATLAMDVDEQGGLRDGYELKLNSHHPGAGIQR